MGITIIAMGSRGDVQPMAALAGELVQHGTKVKVVGVEDYRGVVEATGAEYFSNGLRISGANELLEGWRAQLSQLSPFVALHVIDRWIRTIAPSLGDALQQAAEPGDLFVAGLLGRDCASALAQAHGGRAATIMLTGSLPTASPVSYVSPQPRWLSARRRLALTQWGWRLQNGPSHTAAQPLRASLGLPQLDARQATLAADAYPTLVAASPLLVPPAPDWPANARSTGYPSAPTPPGWRPAPELTAFLAAGAKPIYVGYGSLGESSGASARRRYQDVLQAAATTGERVITPRPPWPVAAPAASVHLTDSVPHSWLFPQMAATVHHGGAGTSAAALLSGVPTLAVPSWADQPYHAWRLHYLGLGPAPIAMRNLTADSLAAQLEALLHGKNAQSYRDRAQQVAEAERATNGLARTTAALLAL